MTLRDPGRLPPGALVRSDTPGGDARGEAQDPSRSAPCPVPKYPGGPGAEPPAPVWFRAEAGLVPTAADPARIAAWRAGSGAAEARAVPADPGWLLVPCGLSGGCVRLSVNGGAARAGSATGALPAGSATGALPAGPAALYIGGRGPRPGLTGKPGGFRLTDVLPWPAADPPADGAGPAAAVALWRERAAHAA